MKNYRLFALKSNTKKLAAILE